MTAQQLSIAYNSQAHHVSDGCFSGPFQRTCPMESNTFEQVSARAEGPWSDLALYSIGWKAFQDLCSQVCEEKFGRAVQIYREAQDGGQDAVFNFDVAAGSRDATIQCKHSSDPRKRLRSSDLTAELRTVDALVAAGQADVYVLMTSMSVDAPVAVKIRNTLRAHGVRKPHVLGKEWLVRVIRSSARLRALIPQIYGLGDLTTILDQRLIEQTRALLDHWIPKLKLYVTTAAHRKAVHALDTHRIVLLLGNPSTGKSTIGAILSTIATEDKNHTVLHLTSPRDFEDGWNPSDRGRFFWIDDAFGSNVMREEYVQDWTSIFRKVQAAITHGNRFLLTSRRHIYEAAKYRLGQRNMPVFLDGSAVVDVGDLTRTEKDQILYNHITFGQQTQSWKRSVKQHLEAVASIEGFLPGIAERLGDPAFTKGLGTSREEIIRFMQEPREHLIDTINALDETLRAALILVYVHQNNLSSDELTDDASQTVADLMGVSLSRAVERITELKGSFIRLARIDGRDIWSFSHPTIADALTDILKDRSHMMAALLRGATVETILSSFVCEGVSSEIDALIVPATLNEILSQRLCQVEDSYGTNRALFSFLATRANDDVVTRVLIKEAGILERLAWSSYRISVDPKVAFLARARRLGLLPDYLRDIVADRLEKAALNDFDLSFIEDAPMLDLIPSDRLLALGMQLRTKALPAAPEKISEIAVEADLDEEPESHFEHYQNGLEIFSRLIDVDEETESLIQTAEDTIDGAIKDLEKRKAEKEENEDDHSEEWEYMSSKPKFPSKSDAVDTKARSIFSDVDC